MKRIYSNRPLVRRMHASTAVVVFAFLFGLYELWAAVGAGPEGSGYGYLFALLFIGGSIYGMRQLMAEHAGWVTAIDADSGTGRSVIFVWRPVVSRQIAGGLDRLQNWRYEVVDVRRNLKAPMLLADHPDRPKPLKLELGKGIVATDELRALAPRAFAKYEAAPL